MSIGATNIKVGDVFEFGDRKITIQEWGVHVKTRDHSVLTDEMMMVNSVQTIRFCKNASMERVFVDSRTIQREVTVSGIIDVNRKFAELGASNVKIAIYAPHLSEDLISKFFEDVASKHCMSIRFFGNAEEAMEWLMGEGQPVPTSFKL